MGIRSTEPNGVLAALLEELGWSPKNLARRLNREFGPGTVAETAPYHWRDAGAVPREPLPAMTAHLLSQELGRVVSMGELWRGKAADAPVLLTAGRGLDRPWTMTDLEDIVDDWVRGGLLDRRRFLAISGAGLTAIVANYLDGTAGLGAMIPPARSGGPSVDPLVDQVEHNLPLLQTLDDAHGGAHHLHYVSAQFRAIGLLLREGGHPDSSRKRLFQAFAEIGQLAGWMAFDAAEHGLAQRYFATALRAAHQVGDQALSAHILADLAFQAASREHPADAIPLGQAAERAARRGPAAVRASVLSRLAYAYASGGEEESFHRAAGEARETIASATPGDSPRWMYFLTENHLECQAGYAMIQLGRLRNQAGLDSPKGLLRNGTGLLATGAFDVPLGDASDRRALFEGAWLALGHSTRGELEQACHVGEKAVARLASVRSPRSVGVLTDLARDLRRRQRNPHVATFLPRLETTLAQSARAAARTG